MSAQATKPSLTLPAHCGSCGVLIQIHEPHSVFLDAIGKAFAFHRYPARCRELRRKLLPCGHHNWFHRACNACLVLNADILGGLPDEGPGHRSVPFEEFHVVAQVAPAKPELPEVPEGTELPAETYEP